MADLDTRARILDAAESLFTEHGLEATTLRQITGAAAVNLAAVNYHFGSKEELIREVFRRRLTWLNQRRLLELDSLEKAAGGKPIKPSQILEVFFGVALKLAADSKGGGRSFMRLLGQTYRKPPEFVRGFLAEEYTAVLGRFKAALVKALPGVPGEEILWRFHFMMGAMSYALSGTDALHIVAEDALDDSDAEALYARLMSFMLGGLRAPLPTLRGAPAKRPRSKVAA
ncbi:MAG: TetR family transcriptional regulator [Burkholderiales bacterium]|nr:TetR family transcriptional regulator [Burkholderiales bacterium]